MNFLKKELLELQEQGLHRSLKCIESAQDSELLFEGQKIICFCSNNYLGLANHPHVKQAAISAIDRYGVGSGASRLISGTMQLHHELEEKIASFKHKEAGIVFPTGYMANVGTITSLVGSRDLVIVDKLNHASIIDACRLCGAAMRVYPHKDMHKLEKILSQSNNYEKKLIITDSLFSMDGDIAPLQDIAELATRYAAYLMIDEAHATGVLGAQGRGIAELLSVEDAVPIIMGTFSKALGSLGGYVVGDADLIEYLKNKARSFIYTTAIPVSLCAASLASLEYIQNHPDSRKQLWRNVTYLKEGLEKCAMKLISTDSQILSVPIGNIEKTMYIAQRLFEEGILVPGIRPPTVPKGTSRLRISVMATHTKEHLDRLLETLSEVMDLVM